MWCCARPNEVEAPVPMEIDDTETESENDFKHTKPKNKAKPKKPAPRKKNIPKSMRVAVWNTYVGEDIGRTKCGVCRVADITQLNFHCAHVVAESKGGATTVGNLRPTCAGCNLSMRTMNLNEYQATYFGS